MSNYKDGDVLEFVSDSSHYFTKGKRYVVFHARLIPKTHDDAGQVNLWPDLYPLAFRLLGNLKDAVFPVKPVAKDVNGEEVVEGDSVRFAMTQHKGMGNTVTLNVYKVIGLTEKWVYLGGHGCVTYDEFTQRAIKVTRHTMKRSNNVDDL